MSLKQTLFRIHWILSIQFGIDPRKMFRSVRGLPAYLRDLSRFRAMYRGRVELVPCLHDRYEEGGETGTEYFWQDLLVARMIFEAKPEKHVDVGSRVDGFVAHVASFREIEVFDVRPVTTHIPGVVFRQADLMKPLNGVSQYCDSLSCLHALEHFGLGRYGDRVDPEGFRRGLENMAILLKEGGMFYLSVPIGSERVEFNANRICDPNAILDLAASHFLRLNTLTVVRHGGIVENFTPEEAPLSDLSSQRYALGIFTFVKSGR